MAKKWVASAKKQLLTAKVEEQEAEKFLKRIEDKHEVTYVDSGEEKDEDDDNKQTKSSTASQEGGEEVGRKRQRSKLPPHASSVETSTLFVGEMNHGDMRGSGQYEPNPYRPRTELLTPVMVNHTQTGQPLPFWLTRPRQHYVPHLQQPPPPPPFLPPQFMNNYNPFPPPHYAPNKHGNGP